MTRLKTDYSKTIIYKLVKNDDYENANVYVGSTTDFTSRKSQHKYTCCNQNNKLYNFKVYQNIRENGGWENWNMIEIEKYPCNDKREAEAREEYWRCEFNARLNTNRAFITAEQMKEYQNQYRTEHADKIKEQLKQYRTENADKIKEQRKQYRTETADKLKELNKQYRTENADKIKQYRTENADKIKELSKQYRTENADKIKQKYDCECGSKYTYQSKTIHFKTKKHQTYLKKYETTE